MNVFQKINEVKKCVQSFIKDSSTSGKGAYKYTSGSQVLGAIKETMENIGLLFLPIKTEHRNWTTFEYTNSYGDQKTDFIVDGKIYYKWVNIEDPDDFCNVEFDLYGQQNDISKAFGSALTYTERYALLKSLGVPTDDEDPDRRTEDKARVRRENASSRRQTPTQSSSAPADPHAPSSGENSVPPSFTYVEPKPRARSKYYTVLNLATEAGIAMETVELWIAQKFRRSIKINDLSDDQFGELCAAINKRKNHESEDLPDAM